MQAYALIAVEYVIMAACATFAHRRGGRGEQLGAIWFAANMAVSICAILLGFDSPLSHLILDGIFALGLLPLAMIFVSYWIGLVTLIAAALFSLEALYLLNEWPNDRAYAWVNNCLWLSVPLVFLISGVANLWRDRRGARAAAPPAGAASA
jgi:cell division protein FtsW (lipid II flippase)